MFGLSVSSRPSEPCPNLFRAPVWTADKTDRVDERPITRYATTPDGLSVTYQIAGEGPLDLVVITGFTRARRGSSDSQRAIDLDRARSGKS